MELNTLILSDSKKKPKYPLQVLFIVSNEFCERFSFYGLRTILTLYLAQQLMYTHDQATIIYHAFNMLCYFSPLAGAIIADSWLGKYKTIFYVSIVYAIGNIIVSGGAVPMLGMTSAKSLTFAGLFLIAFGTGGIKPCVSSFGGDQFKLPEQESHLKKFFSMFYFAINAGSFISTFLTPILREDVHCMGKETCYSLAFGVPALLMVVALVIFLAGKPMYKVKIPEGNIVVEVSKCIGHAISRRKEKGDHWLDKAGDQYDQKFIDDIKAALRVLLLFVPLPIFWALYDQQGSRWTFQATRMTGKFKNFTLKPDQLQVINPVLILIFIPLFETVVYPLFAKCNLLKRPLQKMVVGGCLASIAFVMSAGVETYLEPTYADLPKPGAAQIRFHNVLDCNITLTTSDIPGAGTTIIPSLEMLTFKNLAPKDGIRYTLNGDVCGVPPYTGTFNIINSQAATYAIVKTSKGLTVEESLKEDIDKSDNGNPKVRILFSDTAGNYKTQNFTFKTVDGNETALNLLVNGSLSKFQKIEADLYYLYIGEKKLDFDPIDFLQGGVYTIAIQFNATTNSYTHQLSTVTPASTVNMLWLIPQYVVITAAEILFSITGIEFSFTQAPLSMKSLLTSCWHLTVAFGNLIDIIIVELKIFPSQVYEFLLFAGLMLADMIIFAFLAVRYKYVDRSSEESEAMVKEEDEQEPNGNIVMSEKF